MIPDSLKPGNKFKYTPTGVIFTIYEVTDFYISWKVWFSVKGNWTLPTSRIVSEPLYLFQQGLRKKTYILLNENSNQNDISYDTSI
jgi:hypothetical protein